MHCDVECEGFTFRESVSHALLRHSGRVLDTSGLALYKFLIDLIFIPLQHFLYRPTYWPLFTSFSSYPWALYSEDGNMRLLYFSI